MVKNSKFLSVLKVYESKEHEVLYSLRRVYEIVDLRQRAVESLKGKHEGLKSQLEERIQNQRLRALQNGDVKWLSSLLNFEKRLLKELFQGEKLLQEREAELQVAKERAALMEQDLLQATIEKKKVEQLISQEKTSQRVIEVAQEIESDGELILGAAIK